MASREDLAADATVLDTLYPAAVKTVLSLRLPAAARLASEELQAAARFSPVRLDEFRHGRDCARRALARLGAGPAAIPVGADREPCWPSGIIGSISHAGSVAAAAVARQSDIISLGLDVEPDGPLEDDLISRICTSDEIARELTASASPGTTARLVFGAKEAAYKTLWPVLRRFVEFHDLEVQLDQRQHAFTVASRTALYPPDLVRRIEGRFMRVAGLIVAGATLRAAGDSG